MCGYVWGAKDERLEVLMTNERERQTYYGALNYQTQEFFVQEYEAGNSENTIRFIKQLYAQTPESRVLIIWDGASYHKSKEFKQYLSQVNQGSKSSDEFQVTCVLFAPNAPEQNPVEDIWLQAKNCLRQFWNQLRSFSQVKWFFKWIMQGQFFEFQKLHKSGIFRVKNKEVNA